MRALMWRFKYLLLIGEKHFRILEGEESPQADAQKVESKVTPNEVNQLRKERVAMREEAKKMNKNANITVKGDVFKVSISIARYNIEFNAN